MTIMTQQQIVEALMPEVQVDSVTINNPDPDEPLSRFTISVNYSIYDVSTDDQAITGWFREKEYQNYLIIKPSVEYSTISTTRIKPKEQTLQNPQKTDVVLPDGTSATRYYFSTEWQTQDFTGKDLKLTFATEFDINTMDNNLGIDLASMNLEFPRKEIHIYKENRLVYPIQDFRITSPASSRYTLSDEEIIGAYDQRYHEASIKLEQSKKERMPFVSDFWITREAQGTARFMFFFDAESYLLNRSEYRHYFKNMSPDLRGEAVRMLNVPSLRVLRKRVEIIEDLDGRRVVDYKDRTQTTVVIETSKASTSTSFVNITGQDAAIRQVDIAISGIRRDYTVPRNLRPRFLRHPFTKTEMFFLTGTDYQISEVTDGVYAYGVETTVVDPMIKLLLGKLSEVNVIAEKIREAHVVLTLPENYDANTGTLKKSIQEIEPPFMPDVDTLGRISEVRKVFAKGFDPSGDIDNFLNIFRVPSSVQPSALRILADVLDRLVQNALLDMGESEARLRRYDSGIGETSLPPALLNRDKTVRYYMSPEKLFDSNVPKRTGLDYLSDFSDNADEEVLREISSLAPVRETVGLKVIDSARFKSRLTSEITRYFTSPSASIQPPFPTSQTATPTNLTGPGSEYLTISRVLTGQGPAIMRDFTSPSPVQENEIIRNNIFSLGSNPRHVPGLRMIDFQPDPVSREAAYLSSYNIVFGEPDGKTLLMEDNSRQIFSSRPSESPTQESTEGNPESSENRFEEYVFSKLQGLMQLPEIGTEKTFRNTEFSPTSPTWTSPFPGQNVETWENAPTVTKAMALLESAVTTASEETPSSYWQVSLNFLTRVEYLAGFNSFLDGRLNPLSPVWEPLTSNVYTENAAKNLLCRIKPVSLPHLGVRTARSGKPIFDAVFIVKPVGSPTIQSGNVSADEREQQAAELTDGSSLLAASLRHQIEDAEFEIIHEMQAYETLRAQYVDHQNNLLSLSFNSGITNEQRNLRSQHARQESNRLRPLLARHVHKMNRIASVKIGVYKRHLRELQGDTN